jgi:hypothetical protein
MPAPEPTPSQSPVTVGDIRGAIGSLVILCGRLEKDLRDALADLSNGQAKPLPPLIGLGAHLAAWHRLLRARIQADQHHLATADRFAALLDHAIKIRNGLCHGMQGFSADPHGFGSPVELYIQIHGADETIPWSRMSAAISLLTVANFTLWRLTGAALQPDLPGTADMLDDVNHTLDRIAADLLP